MPITSGTKQELDCDPVKPYIVLEEYAGSYRMRVSHSERGAFVPEVNDVATFILRERGPMSAMKLQKLVYYSQAWSLVWDERPLFDEPIQAWANGPVVPALYARHRGKFQVSADDIGGDANGLNEVERETVGIVLSFYGDKPAQWLSDLTHMEAPWRDARERAGVRDGAACSEVITLAEMGEYYSSLPPE